MKRPLTRIDDLIGAGLVDETRRAALETVAARYAVALTPEMADLIERGDADDPIARQFIPRADELETAPEESADPIGDAAHSPLPGLVHRYPDRVLLKLTHICPVYCRFCFRREMVGPAGDSTMTAAEIDAALAYIAAQPTIFEVIVTGGDPLILSSRRIAEITKRIAAISHVRVLRWHSRVPVVRPGAITQALVRALRHTRLAVYVAVHANHAREFTPAAEAALARLADGGVALLSQSVLLRGVNDNVAALSALMRAFVRNRVRPYYLHHGDLAPGTAHFRVPLDEGLALVAALRGELSGLCQPSYVIDLPGGFGKVPVASGRRLAGGWEFVDRQDRRHRYNS
ncbi:MAG TPA: lysine-2,3-aminomutase-like protein [Beijerinckiaceae bacterium]|nr:lysine-2,3-aminomutase-like protein [Beijerinckiaceae bacterium]